MVSESSIWLDYAIPRRTNYHASLSTNEGTRVKGKSDGSTCGIVKIAN